MALSREVQERLRAEAQAEAQQIVSGGQRQPLPSDTTRRTPDPRIASNIARRQNLLRQGLGAGGQFAQKAFAGGLADTEAGKVQDVITFEQEEEQRAKSREEFGGIPGISPEELRRRPTKIGAGGAAEEIVELTPEAQLEEKVAEILAQEKVRAGAKLEEGQRASERSLSVISTSLHDFSQLLVDAFDEGGFGDIIKATKTGLKQKFAGGFATRTLSRTSAIPGKKVEIITKMMPLLTQQGDKPGTVRLVATVFERLSDSLPGANKRGDIKGNDISLEESREMLSSTILSMLRFAQAIQSLNITNEQVNAIPGKVTQNPDGSTSVEKNSELSQLGDLIERVSQQFFVEGSDEEQQIRDFISLALKPLDDKIAEENRRRDEGDIGDEVGLSTQEELRILEINREIAELRGQQ